MCDRAHRRGGSFVGGAGGGACWGALLLERSAILPPSDAVSLYAAKEYAVSLCINKRNQYANMNVFAVLCVWLLHFLRCGSMKNPAPGVRWS